MTHRLASHTPTADPLDLEIPPLNSSTKESHRMKTLNDLFSICTPHSCAEVTLHFLITCYYKFSSSHLIKSLPSFPTLHVLREAPLCCTRMLQTSFLTQGRRHQFLPPSSHFTKRHPQNEPRGIGYSPRLPTFNPPPGFSSLTPSPRETSSAAGAHRPPRGTPDGKAAARPARATPSPANLSVPPRPRRKETWQRPAERRRFPRAEPPRSWLRRRYLLLQMPYSSSTKAKERLRQRKKKRLREVLSARIDLAGSARGSRPGRREETAEGAAAHPAAPASPPQPSAGGSVAGLVPAALRPAPLPEPSRHLPEQVEPRRLVLVILNGEGQHGAGPRRAGPATGGAGGGPRAASALASGLPPRACAAVRLRPRRGGALFVEVAARSGRRGARWRGGRLQNSQAERALAAPAPAVPRRHA